MRNDRLHAWVLSPRTLSVGHPYLASHAVIEMATPHLSAEARARINARIKTIVVPEFGGIDHLLDDPAQLLMTESDR